MTTITKKSIKPAATLGLFSLVMLMTGAVDGVGNLPSIALFGQQLVFFFIVASVLFLLPTGLVSAELCKQFPKDSGVYAWSKQICGGGFASLVVWLQWINTVVWFPTCLTTLVGTAAYLFDPSLTQHPAFLVAASLAAFWLMTILNLKGVKQSSKIAAWATSLGMLVPMVLVVGLSILWVAIGKPLALHLNHTAIVPHLASSSTWTSLTAIITAFLGMELATVHVKKVKNAHKVFPKALFYAVVVIVLTMGIGSLAVALVIPHSEIVLVAGTIQAFHTLFAGFHLQWLAIVLGVMLLLGSLGTMVNWLISPATGLAQAAKDGYLPKQLAVENKHGTPAKILILQAIVVSLVSCAFFLLPSVNGSYWLLLDLSTELYVGMYLLMFFAALVFSFKVKETFIIPFGKLGLGGVSLVGMLGCVITFVVGFFPPENINVGSAWHYTLLFAGGLLLLSAPAVLLGCYKWKVKKKMVAMDGLEPSTPAL